MIQPVVKAYNWSYHSSIGDTPFFVHYVRDPGNGYDSLLTGQEDQSDRIISAQYCTEMARKHLMDTQEYRQRKHNANAVNKYDIGMLVYLRLVTVKDKLHKLKYRYQGPYRIMDLVNNSVTLKYIKTGKIRRASLRNVRLYSAESMTAG